MSPKPRTVPEVLDEASETSVLDLVDHLLSKGVMITGDVVIGVARVDLIYLRVSALLCAADRVRAHTRLTRLAASLRLEVTPVDRGGEWNGQARSSATALALVPTYTTQSPPVEAVQ